MVDDIIRIVGDITPNNDGGITKSIIKEANEEAEQPLFNDSVFVHYLGKLEDGTEFDSSISRNEPFQFKLGKGEVIKGWDIGVASMKIGEKARFVIKPEYGYGSSGSGDKIPGNSTLVFDVELLEIKGEDVSEDKDGSVTKRIVRPGEGYDQPKDGTNVVLKDLKVDRVLYSGDAVCHKATDNLEFIIGEGEDVGIPSALELALIKMKKGESAKVELKKVHLSGFDFPEDTEKAIYTLTLDSFVKPKETWQMNDEEKLEHAKLQKEKGTKYFKQSKFAQAMRRYRCAADCINIDSLGDNESAKEFKDLFVHINNNLAICYLKLADYKKTIECTDKILEKDSKNEKALFRRGEAKFHKSEWDDALKDFQMILEINPSNTAAVAKIRCVKEHMRQYKEKEKMIYAKMMTGLFTKGDQSPCKDDCNENKEKCCLKVGDCGNDSTCENGQCTSNST